MTVMNDSRGTIRLVKLFAFAMSALAVLAACTPEERAAVIRDYAMRAETEEPAPYVHADIECLSATFHGEGWAPGTEFILSFGSQPPMAGSTDENGVLDATMSRRSGTPETDGITFSYWSVDELTSGYHQLKPITCRTDGSAD